MHTNIQGRHMELTEPIKNHILKKVAGLEKLLSGAEKSEGGAILAFEVEKSTQHHKSGPVFHASCLVKAKGQEFYGSADEEDIYTAIDVVVDNLFREITKSKDRRQTLFRRGAVSVKKMMKGLSKRNPFTSKY
jgi:putative sigma-54 modulation protein